MEKKSKQQNVKQTRVTSNADIVKAMINQKPSNTDPNGSYTGKPFDKNEVPVQDADDL